jgi:hypothetical protein
MKRPIRSGLQRTTFACVALALFSTLTFAQSQATTGDIEGRVVDPAGAAVPNAIVTAHNDQTGF